MATLEQLLRELLADVVRQAVKEELGRAGPEVMTTAQAAEYAGKTAKTVREWIASGALPASRRGKVLMVRREDLDAYLAGHPREARGSAAMIASLKSAG